MKPIDAAPQVSFVVHLVYRHCGPVAQLGERLVRNEEASGSIPLSSTIKSATCGTPSTLAPNSVSLFVSNPPFASPELISHPQSGIQG